MHKKPFLLFLLFVGISGFYNQMNAQTAYEINLDVADKEIETDYLSLGGTSPEGGSISVNSYYVELNGHPFIPIMGEMHYTRIPHEQWEEQILSLIHI